MLILLAGGLALTSRTGAVTATPVENPYQTIVDRNVFSLKPPPPPPSVEDDKPKSVKITLTGITTILGNKRVLMKSPAPAGKPGEPAKPEVSYILTEGERQDDIEVIEIDDKGGNVKLKNAGTIVTLNIDKDGPKLPTTAAPAPGAPGATGVMPPNVPGTRVITPQAPGNPGFSMPTRTLRLPPANGGAASSTANPMFNPTPMPQGTQQPTPSLEQQIVSMELQREANRSNPKFPPLPPTPLTPNGEESAPPTPGNASSFPSLPRPVGLPPIPQ